MPNFRLLLAHNFRRMLHLQHMPNFILLFPLGFCKMLHALHILIQTPPSTQLSYNALFTIYARFQISPFAQFHKTLYVLHMPNFRLLLPHNFKPVKRFNYYKYQVSDFSFNTVFVKRFKYYIC